MNRNHRVRRQRVALRPKVRRQRLRFVAAAAALLLLGAAAALTLRHLSRSLPGLPELLARLNPRVEKVEVAGAPESLAGPIAAYLREAPEEFAARAAELPQRFPALRSVSVRRDWLGRGARVEVSLRRAVADVRRGGRPAGFLDEEGAVFAAPSAVFPQALLPLEVGAAAPEQLKALPSFLEALARSAGLPAPVTGVSFRSPYEGWEVRLEDGTAVLWGDLSWTREKLERLREALADARRQSSATMLADLRYFADGRILLKPSAVAGPPVGNRISTR